MREWPVQDAKAKFSELLDTCLEEGPQLVSRRNEPKAVLVSLAEWERLNTRAKPETKEWLSSDTGRFDTELRPRGAMKRRPAAHLE